MQLALSWHKISEVAVQQAGGLLSRQTGSHIRWRNDEKLSQGRAFPHAYAQRNHANHGLPAVISHSLQLTECGPFALCPWSFQHCIFGVILSNYTTFCTFLD
jgi:hypothetical protein